jgi:hypothetical protein
MRLIHCSLLRLAAVLGTALEGLAVGTDEIINTAPSVERMAYFLFSSLISPLLLFLPHKFDQHDSSDQLHSPFYRNRLPDRM